MGHDPFCNMVDIVPAEYTRRFAADAAREKAMDNMNVRESIAVVNKLIGDTLRADPSAKCCEIPHSFIGDEFLISRLHSAGYQVTTDVSADKTKVTIYW